MWRKWNTLILLGFPGGSDSKESTCNVVDLGSIPGLGTSPREGNDYQLQYSCPEKSRDRGAWQTTVHQVTKSQSQLINFHFHTFGEEINWSTTIDNSMEVV